MARPKTSRRYRRGPLKRSRAVRVNNHHHFMNTKHAFLAASLLALALGGCAAQRSVTKAEPTAFLRSTGMAGAGQIRRLPFERSWRDPSLRAAGYSRIVLRPVSTAWLRTNQWEQSASTFVSSEQVFAERARELARHWDASLRGAFAAPENRLTLAADATQPGTLVLEIALTEVVFGRPAANAASYAVAGGGVASAALFSPSVAFEARVLDGATGRVVATASDRRSTKVKLVALDKFTFTQSNIEICNEWSRQIMQAFNRDMFPAVKRTWVGVY
jgi:hypothetical protein